MGHSTYPILKKKFEDTKGVIRNSKSKDRQHNGKKKEKKRKEQKDKQHGWTLVLRKGRKFLLHLLCYSYNIFGDVMKEEKLDCDYDKRNVSVVICDTDTP